MALAQGVAHRGDRANWSQAATSIGFALIQLDVTIVNVALPRLGQELGGGISALQWIVDGYALVFSVLLLIGGFLGDRYGARRVYMVWVSGLFAAASTLCGLAPDIGTLIAARALQGIGAAVMLPCSLSLLNHATQHDPALRARAVGLWAASGSIALAAGPVLGGLLLGLGSWRGVFLINLPICLVALLLTVKSAGNAAGGGGAGFRSRGPDPCHPGPDGSHWGGDRGSPARLQAPARPRAASRWRWSTAPLFVWVELRSRAPLLLPMRLFRSGTFSIAVVYGMAANVTFYGMVFVLSLYFQRARHYGATETGFAYLPLMATFVAVNLVSGRVVGRFGVRMAMVAGFLVDALGFSLLLLLGPASAYWLALPAFILMPAGMGTGIPAMIGAMLGSVDRSISGVAAAVTNAARQAGGAIGVAVFGALVGDDLVGGMHAAAILSAILLVAVAAAAAIWIPGRVAR